jgi:D-alanyl-lipoteichoic acid acyltransferase DltB (MBOAT superfamily)
MIAERLALLPLILTFLLYPPAAWLALQWSRAGRGGWLFGLVNVLGAYGACVATLAIHLEPGSHAELRLCALVALSFASYLILVACNYWLLRRSVKGSETWGILIFAFPIAILIFLKYVPQVQSSFSSSLKQVGVAQLSLLFLGLSYITFRLIYLAQEVRNEVVGMPSLMEYLGFAFYVPTLSTGPISPYSLYARSVAVPDRQRTPVLRSAIRIVIGLTKYLFISALLNQLTYSGLLRDGHPHPWIDLAVACFAYTLFLYCNFSGFCDMVIGVSGLLGIEVMENFNQPFHARNLQEFWNRWHISLSTWLRDMMFSPMVKALTRRFGPRSINRVIAVSIIAVFLVIGVWHGVGINYALFGLIQGIGLATVHYYTVFLKKRLGKSSFAAYRNNAVIRVTGCALTFVYFSVSLFFFANSWKQMHEIFKILV